MVTAKPMKSVALKKPVSLKLVMQMRVMQKLVILMSGNPGQIQTSQTLRGMRILEMPRLMCPQKWQAERLSSKLSAPVPVGPCRHHR
jgi:hypothetical protein